jgi:hypothetical protein
MSHKSKWIDNLIDSLFVDGSSLPTLINTTTSTAIPNNVVITSTTTASSPGFGLSGIVGSSGTPGISGMAGTTGSYTTWSGVWSTFMTTPVITFGFTIKFKSDTKLKLDWVNEVKEYDEEHNRLKKLI